MLKRPNIILFIFPWNFSAPTQRFFIDRPNRFMMMAYCANSGDKECKSTVKVHLGTILYSFEKKERKAFFQTKK